MQLADPINKQVPDKQKMYQTQYKAGGTKASFFPSTATATTNGSSGDNGSNDPRRTTNGSSRGGIPNQGNVNMSISSHENQRFKVKQNN